MPRCPSEDTLARYGEQRLSAEELARIEEHLEGCEACDLAAAVLRASYVSSVHLTAPTSATLDSFVRRARLARALKPGSHLGRFRLLERMGVGATGAVFAAHDPELDRRVALKVLLDSRDSPQAQRERLLREARSMAKLTHPHVVAAYEIGVAQGCVFLAMELVEGTTLRDWVAARPERGEVVRLFASVAHAVDAGHRAGIVHRDLKPQNILVTRAGVPKVTDFGLAGASIETGLQGSLVGTPAYMAHEALCGGASGPAADQFALAVCLHEALCGRRPYSSSTLEGLRDATAKRPIVDRSIPAPLRAVLERALDPVPARRFPSTAAFGEALAARTPSRARRRLGAVAIAAVVVLSISIGAAARRAIVSTAPQSSTREARAVTAMGGGAASAVSEPSTGKAGAPATAGGGGAVSTGPASSRGEVRALGAVTSTAPSAPPPSGSSSRASSMSESDRSRVARRLQAEAKPASSAPLSGSDMPESALAPATSSDWMRSRR